jgi:hypothetical protein
MLRPDPYSFQLGMPSKGRKIFENDGEFHLKEDLGTYITTSDSQKDKIGLRNSYYWDINL